MAAQNGTLQVEYPDGTKQTYSVYASDSAGVAIKISKTGKADANAPDNFIADRLCAVTDFCLAAATGQTTTTVMKNDQIVSTLLNSNILAAITTRPPLDIMLLPGQKFSMYQVA